MNKKPQTSLLQVDWAHYVWDLEKENRRLKSDLKRLRDFNAATRAAAEELLARREAYARRDA